MNVARRSYANARLAACRSRLLRHPEAMALLAPPDEAGVSRAFSALGIADPLERLLRLHRVAMRAEPDGVPLFRALLDCEEIGNLLLAWGGVVRQRSCGGRWRDFRDLASVPPSILDAVTLLELVERLEGGRWGGLAGTVLRVHGSELAGAELAFDRLVSRRLLSEAERLPRRETLVRELVANVVRERDLQILSRGELAYALSPQASRAVSSGLAPEGDVVTLRRERLRLCRRSFAGSPFLLAPLVATLLLGAAELRALDGIAARRGDVSLDEAARRAMAGSLMEM